MNVDPLHYGRQFADFYDRIFPPGPSAELTAARLAELHPGGGLPSLELGVGTGRIALPLAARTGTVVGIDCSPDMLAELCAVLDKQDQPVLPVQADIRYYTDDRRYGLIYCVCGTLSMLLDPADQQRVLELCARHIAPGGAVVIETHNPTAVQAFNQGRARDSFFVPYPGRDTGLLSFSTIDRVNQLWHLSHIWFEEGRARLASEVSRLTTVDETDAYASNAGLRLIARHADWSGAAFTGSEPMAISVYGKAEPALGVPQPCGES